MWYEPYGPPLPFVSPFEKATLRRSIRAATGSPVAASVTCPLIVMGRSSTERTPGQSIAASATALSYAGWNTVCVSIRNAYVPIRANCHS